MGEVQITLHKIKKLIHTNAHVTYARSHRKTIFFHILERNFSLYPKMMAQHELDPQEQHSVKFESKYKQDILVSRQCIKKCYL